jgi:hypothetical protein
MSAISAFVSVRPINDFGGGLTLEITLLLGKQVIIPSSNIDVHAWEPDL